MSRKRERPYYHGSRDAPTPSSLLKRRRPLPVPQHADVKDRSTSPATVVVIGLPLHCSILDLKSRFEIYGSISRTRIDRDGYVTFRCKSSADAAIAASLDPSFGITLCSKRVQVVWADHHDPVPKKMQGSCSKLVRAEVPLSKYGRGNKLSPSGGNGAFSRLGLPLRGREIVVYDDIL